MINIEWNPDKKKLREFGIVTAIGFGIITLIILFFTDMDSVLLKVGVIGSILGIITIIIPSGLWWFYYCWMGFAFLMGNIVGRVLLAIIYYVVCTILALIMKVFGRDRLALKKKNADSYWIKCEEIAPDKEKYERQF